MPRRYKYPLILLAAAALLVAARAVLPILIEDRANARLQALEGYDGRVTDVDLALWRGAYRIEGIRIVKEGGEIDRPFFIAHAVDFSIEWRNLLKGALVAQGSFERPHLNLVQGPDKRRTQLGEEENWGKRLEEVFPFRFNTVAARRGTVTFLAPGIDTEDALTARNVHGAVSNLTNVAQSEQDAYATFRFEGEVLGSAPLSLNGRFNPTASAPAFDVNMELERVQLPQVNPWLRKFIKADAERGDFQLYMELAAADGRFKGYAKPLMQNVEIASLEDAEPNPLRLLWEGIVDLAAELFDSEPQEQVGARIPLSGSIENPQADLLATIVSVLRNAFVGAFAHALEGSISLRDVEDSLSEYGDPEEE